MKISPRTLDRKSALSSQSCGEFLINKSRISKYSSSSNDIEIDIEKKGSDFFRNSFRSSINPTLGASRESELGTQNLRQNAMNLGHLLSSDIRIKMMKDCCSGVSYLHSKGMMHCDIKSLNFLVTDKLVVKLSDLGEARTDVNLRSSEARSLPR